MSKQLSIPEAIEDQLEGESRQTAQLLYKACRFLMNIDNASRTFSRGFALLLMMVLVIRDTSFPVAFFTLLVAPFIIRVVIRERLILENKDDVNRAIGTIRYLMGQNGSDYIANWLAKKDGAIGKVIEQVISR